jgi:small subunit ribosomal protein S19e
MQTDDILKRCHLTEKLGSWKEVTYWLCVNQNDIITKYVMNKPSTRLQSGESLYIWLPCFTARKNQKETANLTTPHDVPVQQFIEKLAKYLKENIDQVQPPTWVAFAKTGSHVEKQPQNPDWWYIRAASILRKVYAHQPIGLEKLRSDYGGRKGFRVTPDHASKAGGNNIRKILQQLEKAELVQTAVPQGRKMSPKGRKLLQEVADDLHKELVKTAPELSKYRGE